MRIDDANRPDELNRSGQAQAAAKLGTAVDLKDKDGKVNGASGGDHTHVSRVAKALTASDPQRLERIQKEIESGKYQIPPGKIANALIDDGLLG